MTVAKLTERAWELVLDDHSEDGAERIAKLEDLRRICDALASRNIYETREWAYTLWVAVSLEHSAGWLTPPADQQDLLRLLLHELETDELGFP